MKLYAFIFFVFITDLKSQSDAWIPESIASVVGGDLEALSTATRGNSEANQQTATSNFPQNNASLTAFEPGVILKLAVSSSSIKQIQESTNDIIAEGLPIETTTIPPISSEYSSNNERITSFIQITTTINESIIISATITEKQFLTSTQVRLSATTLIPNIKNPFFKSNSAAQSRINFGLLIVLLFVLSWYLF